MKHSMIQTEKQLKYLHSLLITWLNITSEHLGCEPSALEKAKFEYFPLGKIFNKELQEGDKERSFEKTKKY